VFTQGFEEQHAVKRFDSHHNTFRPWNAQE